RFLLRRRVDGVWVGVLSPGSNRRTAGVGSVADDPGVHVAVCKYSRGAHQSTGGIGALGTAPSPGGGQCDLLALDGRPAAVLLRPVLSAACYPRSAAAVSLSIHAVGGAVCGSRLVCARERARRDGR